MAKFELSNIPDRKEDVRYAQSMVGLNARATGRMRVISETGRIECEWSGSLGMIWLPIPAVSIKDRGGAVGMMDEPAKLLG